MVQVTGTRAHTKRVVSEGGKKGQGSGFFFFWICLEIR